MTNTRRPTEHDFHANRDFCVVHVEAGSSRLHARVLARQAHITKDQARDLRINPYGVIDRIELGKFQFQSSGEFSQSGVFIDYAENEQSLLQAAHTHLEEMRTEYLRRLSKKAQDFKALVVSVEPDPKVGNSPSKAELDQATDKLVTAWVFPDDTCDTPDDLTLARAQALRSLLRKRMDELVTKGINPLGWSTQDLLPNLDIDSLEV